jgi:hypothetical protein
MPDTQTVNPQNAPWPGRDKMVLQFLGCWQ